MAQSHHLIASSRVEGAAVHGAGGERLGKIADILIDKTSGVAAYALMGFDGFFGAGERFYPIPWSALTYNTAQDAFIIDMRRADLEKAPSVSDTEVLDEIKWRDALHDFYRAAPYWGPPRIMA